MSKLDEHLKNRDKKERIGETGMKLFLFVMFLLGILILMNI